MKFSILIILALLLARLLATTSALDKGGGEEGPPLDEVAAITGHPEVSAAIEVIKSLRTESSSRIGEQRDQIAFTKIYNDYDHSSGAVLDTNFDKLVNLWLSDEIYAALPDRYKNILAMALKEYAIQLKDEPYHKEKYELSFNDGEGHLIMMIIYLTPHPKIAGGIKWEKFILRSSFTPAPSYVIVTNSDCNLLSCDTTDEIVYLPTVLNAQHISAIVKMNIDILAGFTGHLRSLAAN